MVSRKSRAKHSSSFSASTLQDADESFQEVDPVKAVTPGEVVRPPTTKLLRVPKTRRAALEQANNFNHFTHPDLELPQDYDAAYEELLAGAKSMVDLSRRDPVEEKIYKVDIHADWQITETKVKEKNYENHRSRIDRSASDLRNITREFKTSSMSSMDFEKYGNKKPVSLEAPKEDTGPVTFDVKDIKKESRMTQYWRIMKLKRVDRRAERMAKEEALEREGAIV